MAIDWTLAKASPERIQQIVGNEIETSWMVKLIHPETGNDLYLGSGGEYFMFSTEVEAAKKAEQWEAKRKVKGIES